MCGCLAEPVIDRAAGVHVIAFGDQNVAIGAFALARAVIDEMRHAALEEFVAVHRAHDLLGAVHAVDADGAGKFFAGFWRTRQMQIAGERLAVAERHFDALDRAVHQRGELVVTGDHAGVVIDRLGIALEDRPARGRIEQRRDEIALARRDVAALLLEIARLDFAAMGGGGEFAMHVGEFAHPQCRPCGNRRWRRGRPDTWCSSAAADPIPCRRPG